MKSPGPEEKEVVLSFMDKTYGAVGARRGAPGDGGVICDARDRSNLRGTVANTKALSNVVKSKRVARFGPWLGPNYPRAECNRA